MLWPIAALLVSSEAVAEGRWFAEAFAEMGCTEAAHVVHHDVAAGELFAIRVNTTNPFPDADMAVWAVVSDYRERPGLAGEPERFGLGASRPLNEQGGTLAPGETLVTVVSSTYLRRFRPGGLVAAEDEGDIIVGQHLTYARDDGRGGAAESVDELTCAVYRIVSQEPPMQSTQE